MEMGSRRSRLGLKASLSGREVSLSPRSKSRRGVSLFPRSKSRRGVSLFPRSKSWRGVSLSLKVVLSVGAETWFLGVSAALKPAS